MNLELNSSNESVKAGFKTSEFWLTLLGVVISSWQDSNHSASEFLKINLPIALLIFGYTISRGWAKK